MYLPTLVGSKTRYGAHMQAGLIRRVTILIAAKFKHISIGRTERDIENITEQEIRLKGGRGMKTSAVLTE
jgi:hypothetical protein